MSLNAYNASVFKDALTSIILSIIVSARAWLRSPIRHSLGRLFVILIMSPNVFSFLQFRFQPAPTCVRREYVIAYDFVLYDPVLFYINCVTSYVIVGSPARTKVA